VLIDVSNFARALVHTPEGMAFPESAATEVTALIEAHDDVSEVYELVAGLVRLHGVLLARGDAAPAVARIGRMLEALGPILERRAILAAKANDRESAAALRRAVTAVKSNNAPMLPSVKMGSAGLRPRKN
jgi:hypothetical protein